MVGESPLPKQRVGSNLRQEQLYLQRETEGSGVDAERNKSKRMILACNFL